MAVAAQRKVLQQGLQPAIRTRYRRSAYQRSDNNDVRLSLDVELQLLNETPPSQLQPQEGRLVGEGAARGMTATSTARVVGGTPRNGQSHSNQSWCRTAAELDTPGRSVNFPYAILEVKLGGW